MPRNLDRQKKKPHDVAITVIATYPSTTVKAFIFLACLVCADIIDRMAGVIEIFSKLRWTLNPTGHVVVYVLRNLLGDPK